MGKDQDCISRSILLLQRLLVLRSMDVRCRANGRSPVGIRNRYRSLRFRGRNQTEGNMKLSIEARVAAAVATAFVALTVGVIAQTNSASQTGGPNGYGPTSNPGANTHMSQQGYNSSLSGRVNAQENRQKSSSEDETATAASSGKHLRNVKSRKHHMQRVRENQRTHMSESGD